ncbi:hypothetical protein [Thalassobacillus sp. C254]|uniref:hypothetical protein n=1 Tax=Thalassobacillus sp. C254 TaxID=1225341 RepID=UPI0006D2BE90|nr:hypothetical protein [Thalassobacillus sp. C254]
MLDAFEEIGVPGWTITRGRGASTENKQKVLGFRLEPTKEIILTVIKSSQVDEVLDTAEKSGELLKTGNGISCVLDVEKAAGLINL